MGPKEILSMKKNFGSEKHFESEKNSGFKKGPTKNFEYKKNFGSPKYFESKEILGPTNFESEKILRLKEILV